MREAPEALVHRVKEFAEDLRLTGSGSSSDIRTVDVEGD